MPLKEKTIVVIGAGNMGEALVRGLITSGAVEPHQLTVTDVRKHRLELFSRRFGVSTMEENEVAVEAADIVLLAVKPQQMGEVLASFRSQMTHEKLVISIAAGISTARIERELGDTTRVVRVMPNTPAQIGEGAAALAKGQHASDDDLASADAILSAVGITTKTDESLLDAVTAVSGSGPAYVFLIAEAMIRAGVELGMGEKMARKLSLQTIIGAAKLLVESGEDPATLREKVTSPGGTTKAALEVMAEGRLMDVFIDAVKAAAARSRELSGA